MDLLKQIILVTILAIVTVLPSFGQLVHYTSAPSVTMGNTSLAETNRSEIQICKFYQCSGRERCTGEVRDSFVCSCDRDCAFYRDCCWTADGNCKDRIKYTAGDTSTEICTFTQTILLDPSQVIRVGYFMVSTCPSHYPVNYVNDRCQQELPLFSKQPHSLEEYINHVPVSSHKNKRTYKNVYCAKCNDVEYKDMRFWQLETTCDSGKLSSECDDVTFQQPPEVYDNTTMPRKCVLSDVNNCSSSSPFYAQCISYSAVTMYKGMTFRNPHCALCYDPALTFLEQEICPVYVDTETVNTPGFGSKIPHLVPFDFSVFEETNMLFKNATCSRGLFYNSSSKLCDFAPGSTVINLTDCPPISNSEITLRLELKNASSSILQSNRTIEYLKDSASRYFSTPSLNIYYLGRQDDKMLLDLRLQDSFLTFEDFQQAADRLVQDVIEYHDVSIELSHIAVNCSSSSTLASCQKTSQLALSDVVLFTHDDITSAKIENLNRVYSDLSWDISSQGTCTGNHTCERNITVTICNWVEDYPLCPFLILTNNSFVLEENDNGTIHLMSDLIEGAIPPYDYVILSNGNACVCFEHLKENDYLVIWILFVVFTSLSLLTLLLTFVTYASFKSLRNLPGKITMNFVASLFFAQIILIPSSSSLTVNYTACHVIGILGHYLWLSTFLWMSIIAYDVSRTFGVKSSTLNHVTNSTRTFIIYFAIGWGVSFVYVAMCVIIQYIHIHNLEFEYFDKDETCWLSPARANFVLFGIPAILCLCFNYVTFSFTVLGLHRSKVNSKIVNDQKSSHDVMKEEIFLLLKVSVLMGLSWIWAILYGLFQEVDVFVYLHSILNPLQGFFVFCIYVCNTRVSRMWRGVFRKRFNQSEESKRRETKSTDSNSKNIVKTSSTAL